MYGMQSRSWYSMFFNNEISYNRDNGMIFTQDSAGNLVLDNKLVCNIPENIDDRGADNHFINNIEKPCESCQSPNDFCDDCLGEMDHCQEFVLDIYNEA